MGIGLIGVVEPFKGADTVPAKVLDVVCLLAEGVQRDVVQRECPCNLGLERNGPDGLDGSLVVDAEVREVVRLEREGCERHHLVACGGCLRPHFLAYPDLCVDVQLREHGVCGGFRHPSVIFGCRGVVKIFHVVVDFALDEFEKRFRRHLLREFRVREVGHERKVAEPVDALEVEIGPDHLDFGDELLAAVECHVSLLHLIENLVASGHTVHHEAVGSPDPVMGVVP